MKKQVQKKSLVSILVILAICFGVISYYTKNHCTVTPVILGSDYSVESNFQQDTSEYIWKYRDSILWASSATEWIVEIKDRSIQRLHKMVKRQGLITKPICDSGVFFYYLAGTGNGLELHCYSVLDDIDEVLCTENFSGQSFFVNEDGDVYIQLSCSLLDGDELLPKYVHVSGNEIIEITNRILPEQGYTVEDRMYSVIDLVGPGTSAVLVTSDYQRFISVSDSEQSFENTNPSNVIPYNDGLLLYKHIGYSAFRIFHMNNKGDVNTIVELPGEMNVGTVAVLDEAKLAFFSIQRYATLSPLPRKYRNDELSGTYCIDLENWSVKKVNSKAFSQLYVIDDDGCLYGIDRDGKIFRMNFDGEIYQITR